MTRVILSAADLTAAFDAVRFAVGDDPELPMLAGVLVEVEADGVRLVATDRYRLAVATAPVAEVAGPPARLTAPVALLDEIRRQPAPVGPVTLVVDAGRISVEGYGRSIAGAALDVDFPDYRRLLGEGTVGAAPRRVTVDVEALRSELACGTAPVVVREHLGVRHDLAVLALGPDGALGLAGERAWAADASAHVAVNRGFLLEALAAAGGGQLVLELDGPIRPLAVRLPGDRGTFSMLMPVRL